MLVHPRIPSLALLSSHSALSLCGCTCPFRFTHMAMTPGTLLSTRAACPMTCQGFIYLWPSPGPSTSAPTLPAPCLSELCTHPKTCGPHSKSHQVTPQLKGPPRFLPTFGVKHPVFSTDMGSKCEGPLPPSLARLLSLAQTPCLPSSVHITTSSHISSRGSPSFLAHRAMKWYLLVFFNPAQPSLMHGAC